VATSRRIILKAETCVSCPACSYEIPLLNTVSLPREFSVLCPNCGSRKLYEFAQAHDRNQEAEATQISGRAQFGMKQETDCDLPSENPVQPKSRLNEFASWLLQ
jgi:DNA-directed RNA polymerase subunit RPC12/RpoP